MKLQVIAKNIKDVSRINLTDADSILYLSTTKAGGFTPYEFDVIDAIENSKKKISFLLRRWKENSVVSEEDIDGLKEDIQMYNRLKVDSVVLGMIKDGELDKTNLKLALKLIRSKEKIFGLEFNHLQDKVKGAKEIIKLGFDKIIISAELEKETLEKLQDLDIDFIVSDVHLETLEYIKTFKFKEIVVGLDVRETPTESELTLAETKTITITPKDKRKKPYEKVIEPIPFDPYEKRIDLLKTKEFKIMSSKK